MAVYKVKTGETLSKVAGKLNIPAQALQSVNKGVGTLSTGQVIKVPKAPIVPNWMYNNPNQTAGWLAGAANINPSAATQAQGSFVSGGGGVNMASPTQQFNMAPTSFASANAPKIPNVPKIPTGSFVSGSGGVNIPAPTQTGGMLSPEKYATGATPVSGMMNQSSMYSPIQAAVGVANEISAGRLPTSITPAIFSQYDSATQQQLAQMYIKNPTTGQYEARADIAASASGGMPPRPEGMYTADPNDPNTQKWKDYWNSQAAGRPVIGYQAPYQPQTPKWKNKSRGGGGGGGGQSFNYDTGQNTNGGVRVISWRT